MKHVVILEPEDVDDLILVLRQISTMHPLDTDLVGIAVRQWLKKLLPTQPKVHRHAYPQSLEG